MLVEKPERVLKTSGIAQIQSTRLVFLKEITQNLKMKAGTWVVWRPMGDGPYSCSAASILLRPRDVRGKQFLTLEVSHDHVNSHCSTLQTPLPPPTQPPLWYGEATHWKQPRVRYPHMEGSRPGKTSDRGRLYTARNKPLLDWAEEIWVPFDIPA